jgi:hypothetical protein
MSTLRAHKSGDLIDFRRSLTAMGYSPWTIHNYISSVRGFLQYLERDDVALEEADALHVTAYRRYRLRQYQQLHKRMPTCINRWHAKCQGGICHFLRLTLGDWPSPSSPSRTFPYRKFSRFSITLNAIARSAPALVTAALRLCAVSSRMSPAANPWLWNSVRPSCISGGSEPAPARRHT